MYQAIEPAVIPVAVASAVLDANMDCYTPTSASRPASLLHQTKLTACDELEEEAAIKVDEVLYELTEGKLGQAGTVKAGLPVSNMRVMFLDTVR